MPIGCAGTIPLVIERLAGIKYRRRRPLRILDLGIGFGLWGAAIRNWLDSGSEPWETHLIGVEGWAAYRNPCWDLYTAVNVMGIAEFLELAHRRYDAILILDVIEHFERPEGERAIGLAKQLLVPDGELLVATPGVDIPQGAVNGNAYETHRSLWGAEDFRRLGFEVLTDGALDLYGYRMITAAWISPTAA